MGLLGIMFIVPESRVWAQTITAGGDKPRPSPGFTPTSGRTEVSVTDFNSAGISLVGYDSPEFSSLLAASTPADISKMIGPLLPYSVFLKSGAKPILAYTLSWASVDGAGKTFTDYRTTGDYSRSEA